MVDTVNKAVWVMGLDVAAYKAEAEAVARANQKLVDTSVKVQTSTEKTEKGTSNTAVALNRMAARVSEVAAVEQRRQKILEQQIRDIQLINRALKDREINETRALALAADINAHTQKQLAALNNVVPALGRVGQANKGMGTAIQQAGFQVGDFAVQIASGQTPMRAFIQQGTQLISMFGPWGAVIGAAGAIVGALAVAFLDLGDSAADAAKKQDKFNDSLDRASGIMDKLRGKSEPTRAALEAELSNVVGVADLNLRQAEADLAEMNARVDEYLARNRLPLDRQGTRDIAEANIFGRFGLGGPNLIDQQRKLVNDLTIALGQAQGATGQLDDGFRLMGRSAEEAGAKATKPLGEIMTQRQREIDLLRMANRERAIAEQIDSDLEARGKTRATATPDELQTITDLATAKQDQVDANEALKQSEQEAARAVKDAAREMEQARKDAERANKEFEASLLSLLDRLDPVAGAERELAKQQDLLAMAFERGKISAQQYADALSALDKQFADRLDPYAKLTKAHEDQVRAFENEQIAMQLSGVERARFLAGIEAENKLLADNKDLNDARSQQIISQAQDLAAAREQYRQQQEDIKANQQVLEDFIDQSFDRIGGAITEALATGKIEMANLLDIGKAVVSELTQEFIKLAYLNPLKNMFNDPGEQKLPTLESVFNTYAYGQPSGPGAGIPEPTGTIADPLYVTVTNPNMGGMPGQGSSYGGQMGGSAMGGGGGFPTSTYSPGSTWNAGMSTYSGSTFGEPGSAPGFGFGAPGTGGTSAYGPGSGSINMMGAGIGATIGGTAGYFLGDAIGGKTGGTIGAILGALLGAFIGGGFQHGAAFQHGRVIPYADGDIFDRPTMFPMSGGDTGVLGEAGPEAIMPLRRDARGRLGVSAPAQQADRRVKVTNIFNLPPQSNGFGYSAAQIAQRSTEHGVRALRNS